MISPYQMTQEVFIQMVALFSLSRKILKGGFSPEFLH
jgi:hypothetical protein